MNQYRQGDVFIEEVENLNSDDATEIPRDKGRIILAYGEVTGHAHAISAKGARFLQMPDGSRLLQLPTRADLKHEEHGRITLKPGGYRVTIQRQYAPEGITNVLD